MRAGRIAGLLAVTIAVTACDARSIATEDNALIAAAPAPPPLPSVTPALAAPADPAAARIDPAALAGRWKVVGVAVSDGVQALSDNDPAYIGRELTIGEDRIAWAAGRAPGGATVDDVCEMPVTQRQSGGAKTEYARSFAAQLAKLKVADPDPHAVECDTGNWGPEAAGGTLLFSAGDGALAMTWYDGAVLKLVRL